MKPAQLQCLHLDYIGRNWLAMNKQSCWCSTSWNETLACSLCIDSAGWTGKESISFILSHLAKVSLNTPKDLFNYNFAEVNHVWMGFFFVGAAEYLIKHFFSLFRVKFLIENHQPFRIIISSLPLPHWGTYSSSVLTETFSQLIGCHNKGKNFREAIDWYLLLSSSLDQWVCFSE